MKKTLLAAMVLSTVAVGNISMAAGITNPETNSENIIKIDTNGETPGPSTEAKITSAPSYDFGLLTGADLGEGKAVKNAVGDKPLVYTNNMLKNIDLTVSISENEGQDKFLSAFNMTYGAGTDSNTSSTVNTDGFELSPGNAKKIVTKNMMPGTHEISLNDAEATFVFNNNEINSMKDAYEQSVTWNLSDSTNEGGDNSL